MIFADAINGKIIKIKKMNRTIPPGKNETAMGIFGGRGVQKSVQSK
jgi:hypothetical protein